MKNLKLFTLFVTVALLACGCDFIRATLGKPTSADIQAIRDRIATEAEAARKAEADSIANAQRLAEEQAREALYSGHPAGRYNILSGAFKDSLSAVNMMEEFRSKDYDARLLSLRNGLTGVVIFVSDDANETYARYGEMLADDSFKYPVYVHDAKAEIEVFQQLQQLQQLQETDQSQNN